jgi:transcription antitermination factor NusA-like protein
MTRQNVVLIGGATLTAVAFISVLLYLWKKNQDGDERNDDDDETSDRQNKSELEFADLNAREECVASAGQAVVNILVPQHVVGTIIGKDGCNIKQLRSEFGVRFNFDRDEKEPIGQEKKPTERVLEIRGQRDKVRLAEYKINAIIAETPKYNEEELFVPGDTCGRIIGKGGQNIREMCAISGAKITLEREENQSLGNQRRILLSGSTVQIEYAKLLIKEKVEQAFADTKKYGRKGDNIYFIHHGFF